MDYIHLKDVNGQLRTFDAPEFYAQLCSKGITLFGMTIDCIIQFQTEYRIRGGSLPMTEAKIKEIFRK